MSPLAKHWIVVIGVSLCACEGEHAGLLGELVAKVSTGGAPAPEPGTASPSPGSAGAPAVEPAPAGMSTTPAAPQPTQMSPTAMMPTATQMANNDGHGRIQAGPDETCYEFKTHASQTKVDDTPFMVSTGDLTEQFYFRAPWPTGSVATGLATIADNKKVLHHWFLFTTKEDQVEGAHVTSPLPTLIGTEPIFIAAWSAGGANLIPPDDVGLELPAKGAVLNLQWSYTNATDKPQPDASVVQVCVSPKEKRAHVAGTTWLGTEDLNGNEWFGGAGMPPHQMSTFTTTCKPARKGLKADEPIHIVGYQPHMQALGTQMTTTVEHANGKTEVLFDEPFKFGNERQYYRRYELLAGESLTTSCSFNNTTGTGVPFGTASDTEMCYQFVLAYPVGALANAAASLLGAPDTCW